MKRSAVAFLGLVVALALFLPEPRAHAQLIPRGTPWTCSLDNIGATLTKCSDAAPAGSTIYITDIVAQSTTTTAGTWILRTGTGTNCGTDTASLLPSAATAARLAAPATTAASTIIQLSTPLRVPEGKDLCLLGVATNTTTIQILGQILPK